MKYLVIEGNIGAGKTTLAQKIAETMPAKLLLESFEDNPYLGKFYENQEKYAFLLELSFLIKRYQQHNEFISKSNGLVIADYYFAKSLTFAKANLTTDEYDIYKQLYGIAYSTLQKPDLYVYLHSETDTLLQNIKKRGRTYEKNITAEYLKKIENQYFEYLKTVSDFNVLIIRMNGSDFIEHQNDFEKLTEVIFYRKFNNGINTVSL